jgi:hypothetical protein
MSEIVRHINMLAPIFYDEKTMREQINEDVLCVLRKDGETNQIKIDYVNIDKPLTALIDKFSDFCDAPETTLQQIINFIETTETLNQLNAHYLYCVSLSGSYQAFTGNNAKTVKEINERYQLMLFNKKESENYNLEEAISKFKEEIRLRYLLWHKAFSINKTYRLCHEDSTILTFSHRIEGWSNPVYQLTPNFSVELKTNFGYGYASYFFTKLKYKNIEITPFSEWIYYEIARFSEIVRYTQSYLLSNENWLDAMEFAKEACNLSLINEVEFVKKYIIDECEMMVKGLEDIFNKEHFSFKYRTKTEYKVDKKGHVLVEFRGEKISGALDFISKILEYDSIASIQSFIKRIEVCNKKIQPILVDESKIIKTKIANLKDEISALKPNYENVITEITLYGTKKIELQKEMIINGQLDFRQIDTVKLNAEFNIKYPEYKEFEKEYKSVTESYRMMNEQLLNLIKVYENIIAYTEKINKHFGQ